MAKELLARALKEPRWGELQQGPAISALLSLGTNTALGPGANIAPRALAGTCQEHPAPCWLPKYSPAHTEMEGAARGAGMAMLPPTSCPFGSESPPSKTLCAEE